MKKSETSIWLPFIDRVVAEFEKTELIATPDQVKFRRGNCIGTGGVRHQQIQLLIRNLSLELGYGADIESQISPSLKRVDVLIKKPGLRIACEIPISTVNKEYGNIHKCLAAGFDYVVSIALERKTHLIVKEGCWNNLDETGKKKVRFFFPEELQQFLRELRCGDEADNKVDVILGYRIHIRRQTLLPNQERELRHRVAGIVAKNILKQREGL